MIDSLMTLFLPRCYLGLILSWNRDQVEFLPRILPALASGPA